jgi:hypothetical protein
VTDNKTERLSAMKTWRRRVLGLAMIAPLLLTFGYAVWATESRPPLFPARELIRLQALWTNGSYGPKFTVILSLTALWTMAGVLALPAAVVFRLARGLRSSPGTGSRIDVVRNRLTVVYARAQAGRYAAAVVGLLVGLVLLVALAFAPDRLEPLGSAVSFLGEMALAVGIEAGFIGVWLALEAVLGAVTVDGVVDHPGIHRHGRQTKCALSVAGQNFLVPSQVSGRLQRGQRCAVRYAIATRRVLEVRADPASRRPAAR